jgi:acetoin utilization protein AcuB
MVADVWTVARWMTRRPKTTSPDTPAVDAAELMREHRIRHVPVVDGGRVVGIISDRDLRRLLPERGENFPTAELLRKTARDVMSPLPFTVTPAASLREAAELLCREKIGALPVLEHGALIGIVSVEDLLWAYVENTDGAEFRGGADG